MSVFESVPCDPRTCPPVMSGCPLPLLCIGRVGGGLGRDTEGGGLCTDRDGGGLCTNRGNGGLCTDSGGADSTDGGWIDRALPGFDDIPGDADM